MNKDLREEIKEEAECTCKLCGKYAVNGDPHHITKVSEEPLLRNCKSNVIWVCRPCHLKTENVPGFNLKLKKQLLEYYKTKFKVNEYCYLSEIVYEVGINENDLKKAIVKGTLKGTIINNELKILGENILRFLMGGKLP